MSKDKGGRPSKLNEERKTKLVAAIDFGASYEHACAYAGIVYRTFRNWIIRGEEEFEAGRDTEYARFFQDIKAAEGRGVITNLSEIASSKEWTAKAWLLERRHPEHYGRNRVNDERESVTRLEIDITDNRGSAYQPDAGTGPNDSPTGPI